MKLELPSSFPPLRFPRRRRLKLLKATLIFSAVSSVALMLGLLITQPDNVVGVMLCFANGVLALLSLLAVQRGKLDLAGYIFVGGLWIVFIFSLFLQEGVNSPGYGVIISLIYVSGLMTGIKTAARLAVASILVTLTLIVLEYYSFVPILDQETPHLFIGALQILLLSTSAILIKLYNERINGAFELSNRQAEALTESEARIRTLVEAYFEGILTVVDEIIVETNSATAMLFGYESGSELLGQSITRLFTSEAAEQLHSALQDGLQKPVELSLKRKNGDHFPAEVMEHSTSYQQHAAKIIAVRDLTAQKEEEARLLQRHRLESLGMMAGSVAHDFNNLLMAMMGQNTVALAKLSAENPAYRHVSKSMSAAKRAASLTKQLLAYSGQGHFFMQPEQLNELILENMDLLNLATNHQPTLTLDLMDNLPPILADKGQVQQVLMNLIINAAEAAKEEAVNIEIKTAVITLTRPSPRYSKRLNDITPAGDYVLLMVKDNGCGIDKSQLDKIFEPFYSTKATGRGLGLAAILGIMRGHRGGIHVQSTKGKGTQFELLFPIHPENK